WGWRSAALVGGWYDGAGGVLADARGGCSHRVARRGEPGPVDQAAPGPPPHRRRGVFGVQPGLGPRQRHLLLWRAGRRGGPAGPRGRRRRPCRGTPGRGPRPGRPRGGRRGAALAGDRPGRADELLAAPRAGRPARARGGVQPLRTVAGGASRLAGGQLRSAVVGARGGRRWDPRRLISRVPPDQPLYLTAAASRLFRAQAPSAAAAGERFVRREARPRCCSGRMAPWRAGVPRRWSAWAASPPSVGL